MPAKITPTEAQIQQLKELHEQGFHIRKIMRMLNVDVGYVNNILYCYIIKEKVCYDCKLTKRLDEFRNRPRKGAPAYTNVCKICDKKRGENYAKTEEERKKKIDDKKAIMAEVVSLIRKGVATRKICKQFDMSQNTIRAHLAGLGINISDRKCPLKPKPKMKICKGCSEVGFQDIEKFRSTVKENGREYFFSYCKECEKSYNKKRQKGKSKKLRDTNPMYKLRCNISSAIARALKNRNSSKNGESCLKYLYTINELYTHIESLFEPWMNWENYGLYDPKTWNQDDKTTWKWQVDHIKPQSEFEYKVMADEGFKECWGLANLRPLSAQQNALDGAKMTRHESKKKNRHKKA